MTFVDGEIASFFEKCRLPLGTISDMCMCVVVSEYAGGAMLLRHIRSVYCIAVVYRLPQVFVWMPS